MRKRLFIFLLLFISIVQKIFPQYYSTGQDPASLKWLQIKTPKYQLIYPEPFENKAQYLANIMDIVCRYETNTLPAKVPRIPILLHTQSTSSNGVTVWAPRRIELYPCPSQNSYAEEWLEQLAIHEYRHAVQVSKMNQGFTKGLYCIFGEQITGAILGVYVPAWFLEGDATVTETAMSKTGRGRSAIFEGPLRAQVLEKGIYRYDKAVLGSYKDYIPDAYLLGYHLVGKSREKFGTDLWNTALDKAGKYSFMVVPFNSGIKKITGLSKTRLYKQTMQELDSAWGQQLNAADHPVPRYITKTNPRNFSVYTHPLFLNDSTIIADKSSMDDIDRFVKIDRKTGKEHIILTPGKHISGTNSIAGNIMVWAEMERDHRWENKDYAEIMSYDFQTGKMKKLTHKTRYFAPIISPDGNRVAAVYVSTENKCSLHVLEFPSGKILNILPVPDNGLAITPNWSTDGRKLVFTYLDERGETIAEMNCETGSMRFLLPFGYNEYNGPAYFYRHFIIYSIDYSGEENLFAFDTLSKQQFQITSARFVAVDPDFSSDNRYMIYSDHTSDGLMIAEMGIDTLRWIPLEKVVDHNIKLYQPLARQEMVNIQDSVILRNIYKMNQNDTYDLAKDSIKGIIYPAKRYSKFLNLFNPHSWAPFSFNIQNYELHPGISALSQNILSSTFVSAGWEYNMNEQTGKFYTNFSYQGWYPVFDLRFDIGNRAYYARIHGSDEKYRFTWQEMNFSAKVSIPWNFSQGRFSRYLIPSIGTTLISIMHNASTPEQLTSGLIQTMDYRISASQKLRSNPKDMYPRWGQSADMTFRHSPFGGNDLGAIFGANLNLYVPGIIRHHGIWLYGGYQKQWLKDELLYAYSDLIRYPRGYTGNDNTQLVSLSFNYKLPLFYPDFAAGSVLYFKRFKINLFYDWAQGWDQGVVNNYQSIGAELTADFHILRIPIPVEMGVRSIYFPQTATFGWQFMYSISY